MNFAQKSVDFLLLLLGFACIAIRLVWHRISWRRSPARHSDTSFAVHFIDTVDGTKHEPLFYKCATIEHQRIAQKSDDVTNIPAVELARLIRDRKKSSLEIVEAYIQRIEKVNPIINAMVIDRFAEARQEAVRADKMIEISTCEEIANLPPFFGVPCTIKECFKVSGMPNTSGLIKRIGMSIVDDATAVKRLKEAGAIILGVTNTSELCMWYESSNKVYGRTRNPYDPRCHVGGSSGGEGALIGSGAGLIGLGSDVGGSIRMPAHFSGIFGHKPSGGLVPNTGQHPQTDHCYPFLVSGPLCRFADDLFPLLKVLAGRDFIDSTAADFSLGDPAGVEIKKVRVYVFDENVWFARQVCAETREKISQVEIFARENCASVTSICPNNFKYAFLIWSSMMEVAGGSKFKLFMANGGQEITPGFELLKWAFSRTEHTLPAVGLAALQEYAPMSSSIKKIFSEKGMALRQTLEDLLADRGEGPGVFVCPTFPTAAERHCVPLTQPFDFAFTGIFNVLSLPSTQVPMGLSGRGMPVGVQVATAFGQDHVSISFALALQKKFGGWTRPCEWSR